MRILAATMVLFLFVSIYTSCEQNRKGSNHQEPPFKSVSYYFSPDEIDSLRTDIVSFVGRKPAQATALTRFEPQFRRYYINLAKDYNLYWYNISGNVHTVYLSRPARSLEGNRRGVLATFERNNENRIVNFREILNTVVSDEDRIRQLGEQLMTAFLLKKNFDSLLLNRSIVEWPDSALTYDTILFEWRYVPYQVQ
jgi:hypothetical protein